MNNVPSYICSQLRSICGISTRLPRTSEEISTLQLTPVALIGLLAAVDKAHKALHEVDEIIKDAQAQPRWRIFHSIPVTCVEEI